MLFIIIIDNRLTGRIFYVFSGNDPVQGYPKPLTALGLPKELDHVDAATVWGHNRKTYIFSGTMYWRYDDETDRMELDYPRDMSIWRGIGYNINTAFQWHDGKHTIHYYNVQWVANIILLLGTVRIFS